MKGRTLYYTYGGKWCVFAHLTMAWCFFLNNFCFALFVLGILPMLHCSKKKRIFLVMYSWPGWLGWTARTATISKYEFPWARPYYYIIINMEIPLNITSLLFIIQNFTLLITWEYDVHIRKQLITCCTFFSCYRLDYF